MIKYTQYFETEKNQSFFNDFAFMTRAMSKDKKRYFMTHIFCQMVNDKLTMIETDGRRMHILTIENDVSAFLGIVPGTWDCVHKSATKIGFAKIDESEYVGNFPNWRKVLPEGEITHTLENISFPNFSKSNPDNMRTDLNKVFHCLDENFGINLFYLSDLRPFDWNVTFRCGMKSVDFLSGNKRAVIMPMNCDWGEK